MKRGTFCIVVVLTLFAVRTIAQEKAGMQLPQAEWTQAGDILMHTPGQELFNGVIHPSAGLFEDYFDVDKAAEEHLADETTQGIVISNQKKTIRR